MLLTVDVGNTNIAFGLFEGKELVHQFRTESSRSRTADEYTVLVHQMILLRKVDPQKVEAAIVASVVPVLTAQMIDLVRQGFNVEPLVVGPGFDTGMPILYENPREVGADRIVNAVAAYEQVKGGAIVVDFGTATTFDCITPKGEYLGGCITPGIQISAEALFQAASKLHRVELVAPEKVVGRTSSHSMQSGIVYGYAGLVDGLVDRLKNELGYPCAVIATGGLARLIASQTRTIDRVDDSLTLEGLRLLYDRKAAETQPS
jgi:type III pantothenate kinase